MKKKAIKIKVTSAAACAWYADRIGETFTADDECVHAYYFDHENSNRVLIWKTDCEVVD